MHGSNPGRTAAQRTGGITAHGSFATLIRGLYAIARSLRSLWQIARLLHSLYGGKFLPSGIRHKVSETSEPSVMCNWFVENNTLVVMNIR